MSETQENIQRTDMNVRVRQAIALGILVVLIGGGVSLAWWKLHTPTLDEPLIDVGHGRGFANFMPRMRNEPAQPKEGVRKTGANYEVRSGDAVMFISQDAKKDWRFSWRYQPAKYSSADQPRYLGAKYQSLTLALTDDQIKQFNALPPFAPAMVASDDDQKKLKDLWQQYISADEAGKTKYNAELIAVLDEVAGRSVKATTDAIDVHVAKIKAILTPAQIEKLMQPRATASPGTQPVR